MSSPETTPETTPEAVNILAALQQLLAGHQREARKPVNWSLLKVLCPRKLDILEVTVSSHKLWETGFKAFSKETSLDGYEWETQAMALQATMTEETFLKIDALRQHMPESERQVLTKVLKVVQELVEGGSSKWIHRQKFHRLVQTSDQTARQFFTAAVEQARECEFDSGYCDACKPKAIDDQLVNKLVFCCSSESARRQLLKRKTLTLENAREVLERQELLQETETSLQDQESSRVSALNLKKGRRRDKDRSRSRGPPRDQRRGESSSSPCQKCGFTRHTGNECPAKGSSCRNCGGVDHWAKVCRKPKKSRGQGAADKPSAKLGHIVSSMSTTTERVEVRCEERSHNAVIDTGSDWSCTSPRKLVADFREVTQNLLPPTEAMESTKNASGQLMEALGYFSTKFTFGSKATEEDLVVFTDLDDTYLSKNALVKLGIVVINKEPPKIRRMKSKASKRRRPKTNPPQPATTSSSPSLEASPGAISEPASPTASPTNHVVSLPPVPPRLDKPFSIKGQLKPLGQITREDLVAEFADVFAPRKEPIPGEEFRIVLKPDAPPTKIYRARPVPIHWEEKLRVELDKLLSEDIIEEITHATEWCHALVCASKKNGDIRMCIDFRPLNRHAIREPYHQPPIIDVVQNIKADQAVFFASADATAGYNQCKLADDSRDLTTFICKFGRFRYKRAPFGVVSISDHFNRRMDELLEGLQSLVRVVDDTLIYGKTEEELARCTIKFLQRCRVKRIRLNEKKFLYKETVIPFAGCLIRKDGFTIDPKINQAIREFPEPECLTDVKGFNGLASQLAPYDAQLAKKLHPLRHLLKAKTPIIELNEEERRAFEEVKVRLSSPEVLAYFRPGCPLEVYTDAACTKGFGFLVRQLQPDNSWRPVMLGSRTLFDAETRYAPIEAEVTAMAWALRKARKFLLGAPRFKVFTDHRPLVSLVNSKRYDEIANNRILRNVLKCRDFNMEVEYIKGTHNIAADALSRAPVSHADAEDIAESEEINHQIRTIRTAALQDAEMTPQEEEILEAGELDPEYRQLRDQIRQGFPESKRELENSLHQYWAVRVDLMVAEDDMILYGTRLVIPKSMRKRVLSQLHNGHRGIVGTKSRARMSVYWPNIDAQIEQTTKQCQLCQADRPTQPKEPELHFPVPQRCFEYLSADLADCEGKKFLVTTDWKSGWFTVRQLRSSNAASIIHELRQQLMDTAVPSIFFSDNGPPFNSREFSDFCRRWGIRHITSSPYYAQANTYAENGVKNAKSLLRKCYRRGRMDWEEWSQGLLAIRNTPHANSGLSPAVILYGHQVKETLPAHKSALAKSWHKELANYDRTIAKARQKSEEYRGGRELPPLKIGDPVIVQNRVTKRWDKFGVVQERNDKVRKYALRLPSGLMTVRNRRDLKLRFPPANAKGSGTKDWNPFPDDDSDDEDPDTDTPRTPPNPENPGPMQSPPNPENPRPMQSPPNPENPRPMQSPPNPENPRPMQTPPNPARPPARHGRRDPRGGAPPPIPRPILQKPDRPKRTDRKLPVHFKDFVMTTP